MQCLQLLVTVLLALAVAGAGAASNNARCAAGKFACGAEGGGPCIRAEWRCDGRRHCKDGRDESAAACAQACVDDDAFRCDSGQCVGGLEKCDGIRHCADGSDETPAACAKGCPTRSFRCASGQCIRGTDRCDGQAHCGDGSDELAEACDAEPSVALPAGRREVATVRVVSSTSVTLSLCRAGVRGREAKCGRLHVFQGDGGALRFWATAGCHWPPGEGWPCDTAADLPKGVKPLPEAVYAFVAERRPAQLAVWPLDQPGNVGLVDAPVGPPDQNLTLRVRPFSWPGDFPAKFEEYRDPECGLAPAAPATPSVHGASVSPGAFPWHAALFVRQDGGHQFVCGGSLVASSVVVTAAHCVFSGEQQRPADSLAVTVGAASSEWDHSEAADVLRSNVTRAVALPLYRGARRRHANDLAALLLESPAPRSRVPVCLAEDLALTDGDYVQVLSWGPADARGQLASIALKYAPLAECTRAVAHIRKQAEYLTADKICAARVSDRVQPTPRLAQGNSGGGAVVQRGGLWHLAGVVSVSLDGGGLYGLTDVRASAPWLREVQRNGTL